METTAYFSDINCEGVPKIVIECVSEDGNSEHAIRISPEEAYALAQNIMRLISGNVAFISQEDNEEIEVEESDWDISDCDMNDFLAKARSEFGSQ